MQRSGNLIDETSRLRQFSWEQWDNQIIAVVFRPGNDGLDRYVLKRYVELVFLQSERWKKLSFYFSQISPSIHAYALTSNEIELMRRILGEHLCNKLQLRILESHDQLIAYEALLDLISRAQQLASLNPNTSNYTHYMNGKKPIIPTILSTYTLPSSVKLPVSLPAVSTVSKTIPVKSSSPVTSKPLPSEVLKPRESDTVINGHHTSHVCNFSSKLSIPSDLNLDSFKNARIDGSGWVQINNVYLPFIIKNCQRLVPHQILVSCKILESDELRSTLIRATSADITLLNSMIRECKINNEQIPDNALLINVRHVLVGTKNLVYIKILSKDNPTSKINRQFKSVLASQGGSSSIATHIIPFVYTGNHTYFSLNDILKSYPNLYKQLKTAARVPRTNELDYLQLVQMYYDDKELPPSDTLVIDIENLKQLQILPSKTMSLIEHHAKEKSKLEQQINLLNNSTTNKRKHPDAPHDIKQIQQKLKTSNQIRPSTGYYPSPTSQNQQNLQPPSNYGHRGKLT